MHKFVSLLVAAGLLCACAQSPTMGSANLCDADADTAVAAMVAAHGGLGAWQALESIHVEREHHFAGSEQPIRFDIHAEYASHRIYQSWQAPAGTLAWDGERAWSAGWPLAEQLAPRYVAGIGFYLVNLPWLVYRDADALETRGCTGQLPGQAGRTYLVVTARYEPDPVRKPAWYRGARDHYDLYIDPDSHRLRGVLQHWTYAGRLATAGVPASEPAILQLFVPDSYVEVNGLLWPEDYTAYTPDLRIAATGRFFDYDFSRPFDETLLFPDESVNARPDTSSSYFR